MKNKLRVSLISETEFSVKGHGVHTAYVEMAQALRRRPDVVLKINRGGRADIVHIHTIGLFALMMLIFAPGKKVVSAHVVPESFIGSLVGVRYWLWAARIYLRWFYNRADLVFAVSDETRQGLRKLGVTRRIEVLYNTIDTSRYVSKDNADTVRVKLGLPRRTFMVVGNGQVQPRKGITDFIALAKQNPDMHFVWVGGVPFGLAAADSGEMTRLMQSPPRNVTFTGVIPLQDVAQYLWAADVFLFPSYQETFGLAVVEAAAAGLPIVLRDLPDYEQTFKGFVVMSKKQDDFNQALHRLRDDRRYYRAWQEKSQQLAARFDSAQGAEQLINLYRGIIR